MRDIDYVISYIRTLSAIPPVHKQVLISRIEKRPDTAELYEASKIVYPDEKHEHRRQEILEESTRRLREFVEREERLTR